MAETDKITMLLMPPALRDELFAAVRSVPMRVSDYEQVLVPVLRRIAGLQVQEFTLATPATQDPSAQPGSTSTPEADHKKMPRPG